METIEINGKPHKVSKAVKEHIEWLQVMVQTRQRLAEKIESKIEEFEQEQAKTFGEIQDLISQIKNTHI